MHYLPEEPGAAGRASAYRQMARLLQYRAVRVETRGVLLQGDAVQSGAPGKGRRLAIPGCRMRGMTGLERSCSGQRPWGASGF